MSPTKQRERSHYGLAPFPGPGTGPGDPEENEWWLEREIDIIRRALDEEGEMRRRDLGRLIGCKYWGPGRFSGALKAAVDRGAVEHIGFGRYGPAKGGG
jgi:hypothetical protein